MVKADETTTSGGAPLGGSGMSDYVELTGAALAAYFDAPPLATCGRCGRKTWSTEDVGHEDRMTQPDGYPCGGQFIELGE